ncbi:MAG: HlyD family efflux transporter periplasmic adaptor subunit [Victivallales bacterium]|nr:HlyD family efflux transporter periplasmic adaptor subunit [Victivallales bacterium]
MAKRHRFIPRFLTILVVLSLSAVGGYFYLQGQKPATENPGEVLFPVAKGRLTISVTEAGTVKPRDQVVIKSEVEGRATILYLIPEGRRVKKGELLVELDTSALLDAKVDQEIRVQNAEASYLQSKENLAVVKNQAKADMDKAQLSLRFAKEDLIKYKEGDFPNKLSDYEGRIALAEEDVQRTKDKLESSEKLFAEKYISETEVKGDRLAAKKAKLDSELAASNLKLLKEYTYRRQVDQLSSDVKQAEMALERIKGKVAADVVQAETTLRARESEFRRQTGKLEKLGEQIVKAKIVAPTDGAVVYATSAQFSWRGNVEPLDEGQEVRERQELIHLPTAKTFMAEVNIHEASLKKIYTGLPVRLKVDALPGKDFTGSVHKIAPLPDARSMFMNPDLKVYKTEILIDGDSDVLRTGMTCQVEIVVEQHDTALYVPVQCVVRVGGKPTVFVRNGEKAAPQLVEIGLDNNRYVRIISGAKEGDKVMMTPPLAAAAKEANDEEETKVDIPVRPAASAAGAGDAKARADKPRGGREGGGGRPSMTPEQMKKMREKYEKMSPEEKKKAMEEFRKRSGGGGRGGRPRGGGGQGGGRTRGGGGQG